MRPPDVLLLLYRTRIRRAICGGRDGSVRSKAGAVISAFLSVVLRLYPWQPNIVTLKTGGDHGHGFER